MNIKRFLALLLAVLMLFSSASCNSDEKAKRRAEITSELYAESGTETPLEITPTVDTDNGQNSFALCYSKTDTLNPYNCTTNLNASVATLLYDPLVRIGPEYKLEYILARKINIVGNKIKVELKSNVLFSDGSLLVPQDVVYSFSAAAREGSRFRAQLLPIISCTLDGNTIIFEMVSADRMGAYLLDFPIIKRSSDLDAEVPPTGSGRYVYINDPAEGTFLRSNTWWYSNTEPKIKRILLLRLPTIETIISSVEIGTLSFYYTDLRSGTPSRVNANTALVDLNNIVYLGVNTNNALLSKIEIRRAISNALDRNDIATKSYNGRASAATGPFTPKWYEVQSLQTNNVFSDRKLSDADLSSLGFVNIGSDSIRSDGEGHRLSFSLLVNSDNSPRVDAANLIAEQLKHAGIEVNVDAVDTQTYLSRVLGGNYDLYLGEYALTNNMDITPLISTESGYYSGPAPYATQKAFTLWRQTGTEKQTASSESEPVSSDVSSEVSSSVSSDASSQEESSESSDVSSENTKAEAVENPELKTLIDTFNSELPFIPVCYRMGISCYSRTISGEIKTTEDDPFYNIQDWYL